MADAACQTIQHQLLHDAAAILLQRANDLFTVHEADRELEEPLGNAAIPPPPQSPVPETQLPPTPPVTPESKTAFDTTNDTSDLNDDFFELV